MRNVLCQLRVKSVTSNCISATSVGDCVNADVGQASENCFLF